MQFLQADNLACPLDGAPLTVHEKQCVCPHGHSFDRARQGYVHLLPVQYKKSREPGDSKAMVEARSRFLNGGWYAPISDTVNRLALDHLAATDTPHIVDAGCGEGYYLDRFSQALMRDGRYQRAQLVGLDIAKPAVMAAAKRNKGITWLVASNKNPALRTGSVDALFCMFGFPDYEAFRKILKPGGIVVLVDAAEDHLLELREVIYPEVRKSPPPALEKAHECGFNVVDTKTLRYRTDELNGAQIADLLLMTPHLYRATREGKDAAARLRNLRASVDVAFRVLKL